MVDVLLAEFVGTMILILLGTGVCANVCTRTGANGGGWMVIATGWGLAVMVGAFSVSWVSGAHLNPAVTLAVVIIGGMKASLFFPYVIAQVLGAAMGATLTYLHFKRQFDESGLDGNGLRGIFCTGPSVRDLKWNIVTEAIGTFVLIFGIFSIAEAVQRGGINANVMPVLAGAIVWAIGLSLGGATGYAINPARDFGPRLVFSLLPLKGKEKGSGDWGYALVPIIGPLIGAAVGAGFFLLTQFFYM